MSTEATHTHTAPALSGASLQLTLDAIPMGAAVLGHRGEVLLTNPTWRACRTPARSSTVRVASP